MLQEASHAASGAGLRVGADLVEVAEVARAVEHFGAAYLCRVYTEHEQASCLGPPAVQAAGLAARFAAKEATIKVLRPADGRPDWRSIEVQRHPDGWCELRLQGQARDLADEAGIDGLAVSLCHQGPMAAAVVIAWAETP